MTQGWETVTDGVKLRTRGFAAGVSDSEVIPMERVGELLGYAGDPAIGKYFKQHWAAGFPGLGDRTTCRRQAAHLGWVKPPGQERRVADVGARTADCPGIAGVPITGGKLARAARSRGLQAEAEEGYCAAKEEPYDGVKANLLIDLRGIGVGIPIPAATSDERDAAYALVAVIAGLLLGDKGWIRPQFKAAGEALGIDLQPPLRKNMTEPRPRWWLQLLRRLRQRVETGISHRQHRLGLATTPAGDVWALTKQVPPTLLAHTLGIWLNRHQGGDPLELDGWVAA